MCTYYSTFHLTILPSLYPTLHLPSQRKPAPRNPETGRNKYQESRAERACTCIMFRLLRCDTNTVDKAEQASESLTSSLFPFLSLSLSYIHSLFTQEIRTP